MLKAKNITKIINNKIILDKINVELEPGEIKVLIGPSGGGKSSLLSCLSGIGEFSSGRVSCDGGVIDYPKLGLVFQGLFLRPHMAVKENICLPLREHGVFDLREFEHIVKLLKIDKILDKLPHSCSGGEQQRVALARQILLKSKYLLLDEVTSALDIEHIQVLAKLLLEIKQNTGILIVTHMINFAKSIADYVYFMDQGKIVEEGSADILDFPKSDRLQSFLNFQ